MHRPPSPVITNTTLHTPAPTHNLTLIRTAAELIELDVKLRSTHPGLKIPSLPIDPAGLPLAQQKKGKEKKRKSTFLNTLSRLASPGGGKGMGMSMGIGIGKKGGNTPLVMAPANGSIGGDVNGWSAAPSMTNLASTALSTDALDRDGVISTDREKEDY
ncbi:hypothetical protein JR316_0003487 [Psilocybe cubensis]|uniref:Uncharacterized protein n=3 Tax=Psilocybe cubensis TaxID=181762 RepID=A0A8H7XJ20_PSICU|nr:hypothetical protein JR316_0005417 [Psilocybe cubensis]XP_047751633.1 hypothetical protein JR316_0003487 [Psilocybe cubensis]KAH9483311.1 hypothetical protein JR316_0005417 [Psilocybe cubensis]KAH9484008.1 hypothetical protein JR316_0003487 [Psilocybe cubensis]